jgi:RNA polymerase sigma factor (sigma-70 family)
MYAVCMYYSSGRSEAQDHLQDGFYHLFQKIGKYSFQGSFEGWMRRLFVNVILQKFRKHRPLYSLSDQDGYNDNAVYEHVLEEITAADLMEIIQELSPQYRLVFNLYAIEGYTHKEVAAKLEISEGTSKSNLSRARSILQARVLERFPESYNVKSNGTE